MKIVFAFFFLSFFIQSCTDAPKEEADWPNSSGMQEGDSIPLQEALDLFDSQFTGQDLSADSTKEQLRAELDSLKREQGLDPQNCILRDRIEEIESSFTLIDFVEKDIARRDSILDALVPGLDTILN